MTDITTPRFPDRAEKWGVQHLYQADGKPQPQIGQELGTILCKAMENLFQEAAERGVVLDLSTIRLETESVKLRCDRPYLFRLSAVGCVIEEAPG